MKKIFATIFIFFAIQLNCFAQNGVSFIYINGSNTNDNRMKNWYESGVKGLHPHMKKSFENNSEAQSYFLENGKYYIQEKPIIFYWGDKSHNDLTFVQNDLAISKGFSPWLAYVIRLNLAKFLHDAIWVQKYHNMGPILRELHETIKAESQKGNKIVLYGYSAGSFVTYEYLLTRTPCINVNIFFNSVGASKEQMEIISQNPMKNTCMAALGKDLAVFSASGNIIPTSNLTLFKEHYLKLDSVTDEACIPNKALKGIVNFASPLVLFYSDLSDPNFKITYYNRLLYEYLIENGMFWLTVNYREDPLGFPCGRNLSIEEIEEIAKLDIEPHAGFMYDQSNTKGKCTAFSAHTSYWSRKKIFSKAVVDAYVNGYKNNYDDSIKRTKRK